MVTPLVGIVGAAVISGGLASGPRLGMLRSSNLRSAPPDMPLARRHGCCWPSGPCDVRGVMRSAPHRHGSPQRVPPCRPALRITATKSQVPSGRAAPAPARIPVRYRSKSPAHPARPGGRRQARHPGSAPLHRRPPRRPPPHQRGSAPRRPVPPCSVRASLHTAPPANRPTTRSRLARGGASGDRQSRRTQSLAPFEPASINRPSARRPRHSRSAPARRTPRW